MTASTGRAPLVQPAVADAPFRSGRGPVGDRGLAASRIADTSDAVVEPLSPMPARKWWPIPRRAAPGGARHIGTGMFGPDQCPTWRGDRCRSFRPGGTGPQRLYLLSGRKSGPGRTLGGDSEIQRGRPNPDGRLFGQVTSRTRRCGRYNLNAPQRRPAVPCPTGRARPGDCARPLATWSVARTVTISPRRPGGRSRRRSRSA
jgi:hypothetical protein